MNGVGGKTIAEAKQSMSFSEARRWASYIADNGSLNIGKRLEYGFAMLAHLICVAHKIKINGDIPSMSEFMPHKKQQPITMQEAMKTWK